jgi:hypothetical protein
MSVFSTEHPSFSLPVFDDSDALLANGISGKHKQGDVKENTGSPNYKTTTIIYSYIAFI